MRRAVLLVALAGCELVFPLDADRRDASVTDSPQDPDAMPIDGPKGACTPTPFDTAGMTLFSSGWSDMTIAADESFVIGVDNGDIVFEEPIQGVRTAAAGVAGQLYDRAVMKPDGKELMLSHNGLTDLATSIDLPASWTNPASQQSLPTGSRPGRPASGSRMMMESDANTFAEFAFTAGTWDQLGAPYLAVGIGPQGGVIRYPNLTPDGLGLVFVVDGSFVDGVYYASRGTLADRFSPGTRIRTTVAGIEVAAPQLSGDCQTLWVLQNSSLLRLKK